MDYPGKVLLILGAIGDTLMFTPTIQVLRKACPQTKIDALVMFAGSGAVLEENPAISDIFLVPFFEQSKSQSIREIARIRRMRYDVSILGYPAYRKEYHILSWLLGAKRRLAHNFRSGHFKELAFLETDLERVDYSAHNIENNLNLLDLLNIDWRKEVDPTKVRYTLNLKDEWVDEAKRYLEELKIQDSNLKVGLHPGSTISPAALMRRWDPHRFAEVADRLVNEKQAQIFIFAGPEEVDVGQRVRSMMRCPAVMVDNLKLGPVMALISDLDLFISNDSGLGHVAAGVDTPLVAIWGSTNPRYSSPQNPGRVTIIRKARFPAWHWYENKRSIPKGCEKMSGMDDVEIDDVLAACNIYLKK